VTDPARQTPAKASRFRRWLDKATPSRESVECNRWLRPVAHRVMHSSLWRFTRRSVPRGVALGMVTGILIPLGQIPASALLALPFRANIPIGAAMTFLSNPVTTPFIILASVWLGDWLFGLHANSATFSAMIEHGASAGEWVRWVFSDAAPAMLAGLFVISLVSAVVGYILASIFWDNWIRLRWRRKLARARDQRHEASTSDTAAG